jgi:hypothetical protein
MFRSFPRPVYARGFGGLRYSPPSLGERRRTRESRAISAGVRGHFVPAFRLRSSSYGGLEQRTRRRLVRGRVAGRAEMRRDSISSEHALALRFRRSHHIAAARTGIEVRVFIGSGDWVDRRGGFLPPCRWITAGLTDFSPQARGLRRCPQSTPSSRYPAAAEMSRRKIWVGP